VQVVVVAAQALHHGRIAAQARARADEDLDRARSHEPVDQILRERAVDLRGERGARSRASRRG
jgi:hypothetical protein